MHSTRSVGLVMAAASIYDAAFGLAILLAPAPTAAMLGLALPADRTYLGLVGVLLLVLGGLYVLPARDPVRFAPVVAVSAAGRCLGFLYLAGVHALGGPTAFLYLGLVDLLFAAAQCATLIRWSRMHRR